MRPDGITDRRPSDLAPWVLYSPPIETAAPSCAPLISPNDLDLPPPCAPLPLRAPLLLPTPLPRTASHPATRALSFALPQRPVVSSPKVALHGLHAVPPRPKLLTSKLLEHVPAGFVPAVGALPSLVGGVRQANEAMAWRRVVEARVAECATAYATLTTTQRLWSQVPNAESLRALVAHRVMDLHLELRALDEAASQAYFRLANIVLDLGAVMATALPQLYGLTGLAVGMVATMALQRLVPLCLILSGVLGMAQHAGALWGLLYYGPPTVHPTAPRGSLRHTVGRVYRAEKRFHATQTSLWLAFTIGMIRVAGPLATGLLAPWLGAGLLAVAIAGVSGQHVWVGERFLAPRTLWNRGPWTCQAFATPERQEPLWAVLQGLKRARQQAMAGQLATLSRIRAQTLRALDAVSFIPGLDWIYGSCVRQWLTQDGGTMLSVLTGLHLGHWHDLRAIWVAQTWTLAKAIAEARADLTRAPEHLPPKARQGAMLAMQLAESERTTLDAEARELTRLMTALQTADTPEDAWGTLARFYGLPADGGERLVGTLLLDLAAHNERALLALVYGARMGARKTSDNTD